MSTLRVGVIGAGFFGSRHAQNYAALDGAALVAVCDADPTVAAAVTAQYGGDAVTDPGALLGRVDAVSIATPTAGHHALGRLFLDAGVPVLMEKPIAATVDEADDLIAAADRAGVALQIGHLERYNSAFQALTQAAPGARLIEARRVGPYRARGTDVSVVLDLMIHDLDLVLTLAGAAPVAVTATGGPVFSQAEDFAQAHLRFADGLQATVTASRVAVAQDRTLAIHHRGRVITADLGTSRLITAEPSGPDVPDPVTVTETAYTHGNTLARQLDAFLAAVRGESAVPVDGRAGRDALALAIEILTAVHFDR